MITIIGNDELEKFIDENKLPALRKDELEWVEKEKERLDNFVPICKLIPVYYFMEIKSESKLVLQTGEMIVRYDGHLLKAKGSFKDTTFDLSLFEGIKSPYLAMFKEDDYGLQKPKRVGKITEGKMDDWIKYLLEREKVLETYLNSVIEKIQNFQALLAPYREFINFETDNNRGIYVRGGLYYRYVITSAGQILEEIGLSRVHHDFRTFIQMSDNQYVATEEECVSPESVDFLLFTRNHLDRDEISRSLRNLYRTYISALEKFKPSISFKDVNKTFFDEFRDYWLGKLTRSEKTLDRILSFYKKVISDAIKKGYMSDNPFED